jgi:hypothetical protein
MCWTGDKEKTLVPSTPVYRRLELNFHTQYAEARERARTELELLPGTPGTLTLRTITGQNYWYRRYKAVAGKEVEDFVCRQDDEAARQVMQERISAAIWMQSQVRHLRALGMQVADLEDGALEEAAAAAPKEVLKAANTRFPALKEVLADHPAAVEAIQAALHEA